MLQPRCDVFSHFLTSGFYSRSQTGLELHGGTCAVGSGAADAINLLHLVKAAFQNKLIAQSMCDRL